MPAPLPESDAEVADAVLEDLDFGTPCHGFVPDDTECDQPATTYQKLSCGHDRLACDGHANARRELHAERPLTSQCGVCGRVPVRLVIDEPL